MKKMAGKSGSFMRMTSVGATRMERSNFLIWLARNAGDWQYTIRYSRIDIYKRDDPDTAAIVCYFANPKEAEAFEAAFLTPKE